jgi:hypothetical protein
MEFYDKFTTDYPDINTESAVNIEWVLKTLDSILSTLPTYSAGTGLSLSDATFSIDLGANLTFTGIINVPTPALPS